MLAVLDEQPLGIEVVSPELVDPLDVDTSHIEVVVAATLVVVVVKTVVDGPALVVVELVGTVEALVVAALDVVEAFFGEKPMS